MKNIHSHQWKLEISLTLEANELSPNSLLAKQKLLQCIKIV